MYKDTFRAVISSIWPSLMILVTILVSMRIVSIVSNKQKVIFYREVLYFAFVLYLMCFFYVLTFEDVDWSTANFVPFKEMFRFSLGSKMFFKNILGNIILLSPYGFFLGYFVKIKKVKLIALLSFFVSLTIEIIQYRIGRVFDVDDIILNVIGGIFGYYIYRLISYILNKTRISNKKELICNIATIVAVIIGIIYMGV